MGTGIGKYCKRCGEQLNYDDGFEDGFCNRCYHIAKFETKKMSEKAFSKEEDENEHIKTHKKFLKLAEKQLEEDYKCGTLEVLKNPKLRKELLQKDNQVIKKNLTTEKQGEWREGLDNIDLMLAMLQSIENCTDEEVRNTAKAIREELDKVSQLLSERTFSKEELYRLSIWSGDIGAFGIVSKEDAELINKIYKLLDEENEHIKTHKKFLKLAEKQEEWREIDKDIWYEIGGKRYISINGEEYVRVKDISQLLSERTEEVLDQIYNFVESEMLTIEKDGTGVVLRYIEEWKSKLNKKQR